MSTTDNTPNYTQFSNDQLKLSDAIGAFGDFIDNLDTEHDSYCLIRQIYETLKNAHTAFESHFDLDLEVCIEIFLKTSQNGQKTGSTASNVTTMLIWSRDKSWGSLSNEP